MFCLYISSKRLPPQIEFSLKAKVMGSNPGYLLKSFLLGKKYHLFSVILKELAFRDSSANVLAALAFNCRNVASCFLIKYVPPPSMFELNWLQDFVKFADYIIW